MESYTASGQVETMLAALQVPGGFERDGLSVKSIAGLKIVKTEQNSDKAVLLLAESYNDSCGELILIYLKARFIVFVSDAKS